MAAAEDRGLRRALDLNPNLPEARETDAIWLLLAHLADWRWMPQRDDSPWYPSATLLRQPERGDWDSVLADAAERLAAMADGNRPAGHREHNVTGGFG